MSIITINRYKEPYNKGDLVLLYIAITHGDNQWEAEWIKRGVYIEVRFGPISISSTQFILQDTSRHGRAVELNHLNDGEYEAEYDDDHNR